MDMLDMVITKVDPEISKVYEDKLADKKLKIVGEKLREQFEDLKSLNKKITPVEILKQRKIFRSPVIIRNIYSEVLHIIQAIVMKKISIKKLNKTKKKYLNDSLMTSIAGISAAMKNTG
jgi:phosphoenolpyruvate carboxylase